MQLFIYVIQKKAVKSQSSLQLRDPAPEHRRDTCLGLRWEGRKGKRGEVLYFVIHKYTGSKTKCITGTLASIKRACYF